MSTLYVIGNGFDLANGVRSSYRDFREHLLSLGPEGVRMAVTLESYLGSSPDLWGDFEESLGFLDRGMAMDSVDDAFDDHGDVRGCVERGLAGVKSIEEELPRLFRSWLRTLRAEGPVWEPPVPLDPDGAYIDFNYTDLLESRYGIPRGNILYIHGSVAGGGDSIVMGTSNQSEMMMGYFTKFGDGACDVTPLANLYKTEVRQLARLIGIPEEIISKPPSAGLWEGQTDESEMGITYSDLDQILYDLEQDRSDAQIAADTGLSREKVSEIRKQVESMEHKRLPPIRQGEF